MKVSEIISTSGSPLPVECHHQWTYSGRLTRLKVICIGLRISGSLAALGAIVLSVNLKRGSVIIYKSGFFTDNVPGDTLLLVHLGTS